MFEQKPEDAARGEALMQRIKEVMEQFNKLSPEEQAEHYRLQRESYVRAEMSWPAPKYEMKMIDGVMTKVYASFEDYCNG